jgi:hypothetical protein
MRLRTWTPSVAHRVHRKAALIAVGLLAGGAARALAIPPVGGCSWSVPGTGTETSISVCDELVGSVLQPNKTITCCRDLQPDECVDANEVRYSARQFKAVTDVYGPNYSNTCYRDPGEANWVAGDCCGSRIS